VTEFFKFIGLSAFWFIIYMIVFSFLNYILIKKLAELNREKFKKEYEEDFDVAWLLLISSMGIFTTPINLYWVIQAYYQLLKPTPIYKKYSNFKKYIKKLLEKKIID
jgi:hypothetical protein